MKARWASLVLPVAFAAFAALVACAPQHAEPNFDDLVNSHGYSRGCSWYCGCPPVSVKASSTKDSHIAKHLHDEEADSVWIAGASGTQTLTFEFDMGAEGYGSLNDLGIGVEWVSIINGDARSKRKWAAHARAKTLVLRFNGKRMKQIELKDTMDPQQFDLPKMLFVGGKVNEISFEIVDTHPGKDGKPVAMADFYFSGFGQIH